MEQDTVIVNGTPMRLRGCWSWPSPPTGVTSSLTDADGREWEKREGAHIGLDTTMPATTFIGRQRWVEGFLECQPSFGTDRRHSRWHVPAICDGVRRALWRWRWRKALAFNAAQRADPANTLTWERVGPGLWRCPKVQVSEWFHWNPSEQPEINWGANYR